MPLKDSLLAIANKVSLDYNDVLEIKRIAADKYDENPHFCYTLGIVCEYLLNPWTPDKAQELIEPIRRFLHSSDNSPEFGVEAANAFTRILSSRKN